NLDAAIHLADQGHAGHLSGDHLTLSITDAQAGVLASHHFGSFGTGDVLVDGAHSTHLSTSLKDLESLNIAAVSVGADGLTVDLGGMTTGTD
ncbi:hypothetical protein G6672_09365, partial [Polynucleobacter paneuropaeus]|nr:hypothetical protein [Polynucleobacter paneuropaeus]